MRHYSNSRHYFTAAYCLSSRHRLLVPSLLPSSSGILFGTCNAFFPPRQLCHHHRRPPSNCGNSDGNTLVNSLRRFAANEINDKTEAMWDPTSQTYKDGIVPSHHTAMDVDDLLHLNRGKLKIFGYGSLCWNPGTDGILSLANIEQDELDHDAVASFEHLDDQPTRKTTKRQVTTTPGRAVGYQRCWCQRSADHRGTPQFNGIVCTLLSDEEVWKLHHGNDIETSGDGHDRSMRPSMTEGMIYTVDRDLVEDCLTELDFREKGGYARDVIDVVEDDTGNTIKALLYRGTPDNPAFWKRALLDLPYAAAIMSAAIGPSGPNDVYLHRLHHFLTHAAQHSSAAALALQDHSGDTHTGELATMVHLLQSTYRPYFLFGTGSNEHNQLLLKSEHSGVHSGNGGWKGMEEVHELTEMLLVVPRRKEEATSGGNDNDDSPKSLHAGGGHSALLTTGGDLYLWGWNNAGQLGRNATLLQSTCPTTSHFSPILPLPNIKVETVSLGHSHTLVIERGTGHLFGFGENGRGQVTGRVEGANDTTHDLRHAPCTPAVLSEECFVDAAAGLFHSAAITVQGELITWGCGRFDQCLPVVDSVERRDHNRDASSTVGRWRPPDGSKLVKVACGRRHTIMLDEHGRVWTMGDNKYGQLGRSSSESNSKHKEPRLVDGPLGRMDSGCFAICSGWSHILALSRNKDFNDVTVHGWGRNDKGQLGALSRQGRVCIPRELLKPSINSRKKSIDGMDISIQSACCGSESSHILDIHGDIYSTGWNEHGNLGIRHNRFNKSGEHCSSWKKMSGVSVVAPPPSRANSKLFAAGGAHCFVMAGDGRVT